MELKSIALYLPVIASVLWAVVYTVTARNYEVITVPTGMIVYGIGIVLAGCISGWILNASVDFTPFFDHSKNFWPEKFWLWLVPVAVVAASLALHLSLKVNSASYTGLVEILYVVFIPIFAYVFFGHKELNLSMLIGGALMLAGVGFVFYGQWQKSV